MRRLSLKFVIVCVLAVWLVGLTNSAASESCVEADNSSGTITLPPDCNYTCPGEPFKIIDGLPSGTTIELDGILMDFVCCDGPSKCSLCSLSLGAAQCETTGGSLGGHGHCFTATLDLTVSGTGDLTGFNRHLAVPVFGEVHTGPRNAGEPVQDFNSVFFRLFGELFGDPDFCTFRIRWGTDYNLPSPGHTTLTQLPSGDFAVDSFFDITYEIEFEGCPDSNALSDLSGTTTETLRMETGFAECKPTPDGTACDPAACLDTDEECHPVCVNFDMATGEVTILDCNCGEPNDCRVYIPSASGQPCMLPDNGTGTPNLPPIGCEYNSPNDVFKIIDGLPIGTTIEMDGTLMNFVCCGDSCTNCSMSLGGGQCEMAGGSLGGDGHCFTATLDLDVNGTGDLAGFNRHLAVPVHGEVHTGPRKPGEPVQDFNSVFFRLDGELFGDPDFCEFIVTWGTDYGLASPGHTTLTQLPTGDFAVDSFFDITYQIEFEGCPSSVLKDCSGITTAATPLRMVAGGPVPSCIGDCPPGMVCDRTMTVDCDDGTLKICCKPREPSADLNRDGIVNFKDFAFMANQWLRNIP